MQHANNKLKKDKHQPPVCASGCHIPMTVDFVVLNNYVTKLPPLLPFTPFFLRQACIIPS